MSEAICIFKRVEKKYKLSHNQKNLLLREVGEYLIPDAHGESTICSLYLDTPDFRMIRNSMEAKVYKEKMRLRSYGVPKGDSPVFLELKKKYQGVVYKRRVSMTLEDAKAYLDCGKRPFDSQIMSEIDYAMDFYNPKPAMMIAYEREAFFVKDMPNLRLTFDASIRYRETGLQLEWGAAGKKIIPDDTVLLEIKTDGAMPVWLAHALDKLRILPTSFSKYRDSYQDYLLNSNNAYKGVYKNVYNF